MNKVDYRIDSINGIETRKIDAMTWEYKKKYRDKTPMLNEESYFFDYKHSERRQR